MIRSALLICGGAAAGAFLVEGPALPGGLAEGQTYQGAVAKAGGIIAEWIEPAHELGRPG